MKTSTKARFRLKFKYIIIKELSKVTSFGLIFYFDYLELLLSFDRQ